MGQAERAEKLIKIRDLAERLSDLSDEYEDMYEELKDNDPEWRMACSMISQSLEIVAEKVDALAGSPSLR